MRAQNIPSRIAPTKIIAAPTASIFKFTAAPTGQASSAFVNLILPDPADDPEAASMLRCRKDIDIKTAVQPIQK
jgi:hypothetical protein